MRMAPGLRKFMLTVHLATSVGWLGAVAAYLVLDLSAATSQDAQAVRAAWFAMKVIVSSIIVPLALASLLTGVVQSLGTKWGLFRYWWVLISFLLTIVATFVLLVETGQISRIAEIAANPATSTDNLRTLGSTLLHSVGGLLVLIVITTLNVYKPQGLTPYGWRKEQEERARLARRAPTAGRP